MQSIMPNFSSRSKERGRERHKGVGGGCVCCDWSHAVASVASIHHSPRLFAPCTSEISPRCDCERERQRVRSHSAVYIHTLIILHTRAWATRRTNTPLGHLIQAFLAMSDPPSIHSLSPRASSPLSLYICSALLSLSLLERRWL